MFLFISHHYGFDFYVYECRIITLVVRGFAKYYLVLGTIAKTKHEDKLM